MSNNDPLVFVRGYTLIREPHLDRDLNYIDLSAFRADDDRFTYEFQREAIHRLNLSTLLFLIEGGKGIHLSRLYALVSIKPFVMPTYLG